MEKIRVFTAFSGYDSQCMALDRLGVDYELVGWSEIDRYAIQAHNAIYPQWSDRNYGDISKVDWSQVPDFDLFTMSSPCQDFSNAGLQRGGQEGSGTRSSLLWECRKAILAKRPKYVIFENVTGLAQDKFVKGLNKWQYELEDYGYTNHCEIINAKHYGIPQTRERLFMVSILNEEGFYCFPERLDTNVKIKDILEDNVSDKYNLSDKMLEDITYETKEGFTGVIELANLHKGGQKAPVISIDGICSTLTATDYKQPKQIFVPKPKPLLIKEATKKGYVEVVPGAVFEGSYPKSKTRRGCLVDNGDTCPTLTCNGTPLYYTENFIVRRLTEREYFRIMGVSEENIDKIRGAGISKTQQYKMAGNSIVVDVLYYIFKNLFFPPEYKTTIF